MSWGMSSRTTPRETSLASLDAMVSAVMGSELQRCRSCGGVKTYGCTPQRICLALRRGSCLGSGLSEFKVTVLEFDANAADDHGVQTGAGCLTL